MIDRRVLIVLLLITIGALWFSTATLTRSTNSLKECVLSLEASTGLTQACLDSTDRCIDVTESCLEKWHEDKVARQRRIFKWEICSSFENCWSCISQTAEGGNTGMGDVEWCFEHACDGVSGDQCTDVLENMLYQYFEVPIIRGPVG